ncbi:ThiF family adenylyltransferase [Chryseobacterium tongliaoense]|uniref:ThiF family adenylyltransferase n=1 Tax=Chryseobacterium tongliaoense TaxID=3240933 RepID=UPI0035185650
MEEKYVRNRIYVTENEQELIKNFPILIGGCGIGSNIAECALRFGFENLTLVDGDRIEESNLNRQNYTAQDISHYKSETLYKRLKTINPSADIRYMTEYIHRENANSIIQNHKAAINALDFSSDIPLYFDAKCRENNINVLHPYNLGWAGLVAVITPHSAKLESITDKDFNELEMVRYVLRDLQLKGRPYHWLENTLNEYTNENVKISPPQLSIASWTVAATCTHLLYLLATNKEVNIFPEYYLRSAAS